MIQGLFETHIRVSNLESAVEFYCGVLGLQVGYQEAGDISALLWVGEPNTFMLGLVEKTDGPIPWQHLSFRVSLDDILHAVDWLRARQLQPKNRLHNAPEQLQVFCWMPAVSIFFDDPDGNLLELIAPLPQQPRPELGIISWDEWQAATGQNR